VKPLSINFVPPKPFPIWARVVVLLLLMVMCAYQGKRAYDLHVQLKQTEQELIQASAELAQLEQQRQEAEKNQVKPPPPYLEDALAVAQLAKLSMPDVLSAVESPRVPGVRLTSLEASAKDLSVRIDVEFDDQKVLLRYLDELNAHRSGIRWQLVQAQFAATSNNVSMIPTATLVGKIH